MLLPGNEARIVDPESGADLDCNQAGEILVKSLAVMKGKIYILCLFFIYIFFYFATWLWLCKLL